ncbi:ShlB/FhaC/HecB family hemolysin secretion/activation protein [Rubrivivax gelatinosus]|uniref:Polypeptide-transport-associated domain protein, ShlB-type n=1 Tax=Rubrivivax gelatinosus (strain NBRC 100245 / IL144) TaxID=983917 RepID=I0HVY7_RUBGI|nr:ShlB/FhaC/HecB family hemolysin secretion/activation protein [Rubrivivax gelatinosus]BAL97174.1 polypeptide-transport-associated domain protein, ShlB-type [Rubrivivax gelatinosus IL144]
MHKKSLGAVAAATLLVCGPLHAQTPPDAGKLLRDTERGVPVPPPPPPTTTAPAASPDAAPGARVQVVGFRLRGVTLLSEAELQVRLAPFVGQPASLADLRRAADTVARAYEEAGYLVRAFLPEQTLSEGIVTIEVLEGRLSGVRVEQAPPGRNVGERRVVETMTARQKVGAPVRADDVQRAVGLLDSLPGVQASSVLEPGEQPGETRLVVAVLDEPMFGGHLQLDNAGTRASGEWRSTGSFEVNSPLRFGDQLQFFGSHSAGSDYGSAGYSLPVGYDGWRASATLSRLAYGYDLNSTRYSGGATSWAATASYALLRRAGASLSLSLAYDHKAFDNAIAGLQINDKTVATRTLALGGDAADAWLGGGVTQFSLSLAFGRLDLGGNAADLAADQGAGGPDREGSFRSLGWSLTRLQRLSAADTLQLSWSGQRANRNLDSSQKFNVTGPSAVRAYSSSEPSGDDGTLASIEWRHQLTPELTLSLFHDHAWLRRDHERNSATLDPNRYTLAGHGLGATWSGPGQLLARAALSWRAGRNPVRTATGDDSDGTQRDPRLFVSLVKAF